MKKIILALACAVSVIVAKASESEWFSGSASGTQLSVENATWSPLPVSGVEVAGSVITLDDFGYDAALTLTPTENSAPDRETKTSINVTANFYPNAFEDLERPTDAQTALAVAYATTDKSALSYYAWNGSDWVALSGATPVAADETEVTAKIELDYYRSGEPKARFTIGTDILTCQNGEWLTLATTSRVVNNVAFAGSGKLRSVASTVELGVARVGNVKYPTYAAAIAAAGGSQIVILRESETETLGEGALADYKASVVDNVKYLVAKVYVAQIGDTKYETLEEAVADYTTGSSIIVLNATGVDIPAGWKIENNKLVRAGIVVDGEVGTGSEKTFILAVPKSTTTLTAATLINTANRVEGDQLKVYDKSKKSYYSWQLAPSGDTLVWDPLKVIVATDAGQSETDSPEAGTIQLTAGQGVWVTVKDDSKTVLLNGQYAGAEEKVDVALETGWNLVAPPPKEGEDDSYSINSVVSAAAAADGDRIVVPTAGVPYNLTKGSDGKWGYYKITTTYSAEKKRDETTTEWVDEVTVPSGTGFWYINGGDSTKNISL